jgi:hypothetical protein
MKNRSTLPHDAEGRPLTRERLREIITEAKSEADQSFAELEAWCAEHDTVLGRLLRRSAADIISGNITEEEEVYLLNLLREHDPEAFEELMREAARGLLARYRIRLEVVN